MYLPRLEWIYSKVPYIRSTNLSRTLILFKYKRVERFYVGTSFSKAAVENHHYPILVAKDRIYVQLVAGKEVIEATIQNFKIPGLSVTYELRSPNQQLTFQKHFHQQHDQHHEH